MNPETLTVIPVCVVVEHPYEITLEIVPPSDGVYLLHSLRPIGAGDHFLSDEGERLPPNSPGLCIVRIESVLDATFSTKPVELDALGHSLTSMRFSKLAPIRITFKPPNPCTLSVVLLAEPIPESSPHAEGNVE